MVLELDAEFMVPLNIKSYYFDLSKSVNSSPPEWKILHDYVSHYEMEDFSPDSVYKLAERVKEEEDMARLYAWNRRR